MLMRSQLLCSFLLLLLVAPLQAQESPAALLSTRAPASILGAAPLDARVFPAPVHAFAPDSSRGQGEIGAARQVLYGIGGGVLGAIAVGGTWALYLSTLDPEAVGEYDWLGPIIGALVLGYPLGSGAGVYLGSRREAPGGSAVLTFGGAVLGFLAGGALADPTGGVSFVLGPPLGATWAYNLSRRHRMRAARAGR
jgi:hypothetical protein